MIGWKSVKDELPSYGDPVLIVSNGVVQNVTYMRDGADDCSDWYEPFHFEHDDNCKTRDVTFWMELPPPPSE